LRHYADQRISLYLDDGVKVNYGKFGNLLAEVKAVTAGEGLTTNKKITQSARLSQLQAFFLTNFIILSKFTQVIE